MYTYSRRLEKNMFSNKSKLKKILKKYVNR